MTEGGGIGLDCGGHVIVMPIRKWHALAAETRALPASGQAAALCNGDSHVLTAEGCQCGAYKIVKDRTDVENEQRERLKKRLAGRPRPPRDAFEDIGVPMLNEDKPSATPPTFESDAALVEASALAISRARLEEARLWLQAGWDLTDSADRRYGERRISELECQADAPPVEAVGQQGADAIVERCCKAVCVWCAGVNEFADCNAVPNRWDRDDYIPNFGEVHAGDWIHGSGTTRYCDATPIRNLALKGTLKLPALTLEQVRAVLETHNYPVIHHGQRECGCGEVLPLGHDWVEHILALLAAPETEKR